MRLFQVLPFASLGFIWCLPLNGLVPDPSAISGSTMRGVDTAPLGVDCPDGIITKIEGNSADRLPRIGEHKKQGNSAKSKTSPKQAAIAPDDTPQAFHQNSDVHTTQAPASASYADTVENEGDQKPTDRDGLSCWKALSWFFHRSRKPPNGSHALIRRGSGRGSGSGFRSWVSSKWSSFKSWFRSSGSSSSRGSSSRPSGGHKSGNSPSDTHKKKGVGGGGRGGGSTGGSRGSGSTKGGKGSKGDSKNQGYGSTKRPDYANERDPPPPYSPAGGPPPPYSPGSYGQRGPTRSYWNGQYYPYRNYGYGALLPLGLAAPFFFAGPFGAYGHYCRSGIRENCTVTDFYVNGTWVNETTIEGGVYHHLNWEDATYEVKTVKGGSYVGGERLKSDPSIAVNGTFVANTGNESETSKTINPNVTANGTELQESSDNHAFIHSPGWLMTAVPIGIGVAMMM